MARTAAILGVTGRLGPAVARALVAAGWEVRGLSRRAPLADERVPGAVRHVNADRLDSKALREVVDGADAVIDLLGFVPADADALLGAIEAAAIRPARLVFASSVAEQGSRSLGRDEDAPRTPDDPYGQGKLDARRRLETGFAGPVHSLVLPRLVAEVDPKRREQPYLDSARATGRGLVAGSGEQRQLVAPVEGVADVIRRLLERDDVPAGPLNVGPPQPVRVNALVQSLLQGAGIAATPGRHPDRHWRGPHGGGDEPLDTTRLQRLLGPVAWPDVGEVHRRLGAWLAASASGAKRPAPLVRFSHRAPEERRLVDVHGRRREAVLAETLPPLAEVAGWLSPAFALDVGRPCNSACLYCSVPPHGDTRGFTPLEAMRDRMATGLAAGCDRAIFVGGEPTIYPPLFDALAALREAGFQGRHVVMTNGLRLADAGFVDALADAGVATIHLSVDTADEAIYERISRSKGTFETQRKGLRNVLARPRLNLYVYSVATKLNVAGLPALYRSVAALSAEAGRAPPPVLAAFVKPVGDALTHASELLLSPEERAHAAAVLVAAGRAAGITVGLRNLQACLAPELLPHLVDYYLEDYSVDVRTGKPEPYEHNAANLRSAAACVPCAHRNACPGAYSDDLIRYGDGAFRTLGPAGLRSPAVA